MLRPLLVLLLVSIALAGCSSGVEPTIAQPASSSSSTAPPVLADLVRTDTLYLLESPHLAGALPTGGAIIRTYVPTDLDSLEGAQVPVFPKWTLPRPDLAELEVTIRLWIDVQGVVTNPPRGAFNCFWSFSFFIEHNDGTRTGLTSYCSPDAPVVPTGIRMQEHSFVETPDLAVGRGDRLGFDINTYGAYAPDASVDILSGTAEFDSSFTITGLQLPIDTQTLLL